jgi:hypothetical protein
MSRRSTGRISFSKFNRAAIMKKCAVYAAFCANQTRLFYRLCRTQERRRRNRFRIEGQRFLLRSLSCRDGWRIQAQSPRSPRQTGLAILSAIKEAGTALSASSLINVLRGARKGSYISNHPELLALTQFGSEKERNYNEILMHILAMWAKGYLRPASGQNKRLELTPKGQNSLDKTMRLSSD